MKFSKALCTYVNSFFRTFKDFDMPHERKLLDGKKKKDSTKSLKEKRAEKKAKHEEIHHVRKPRSHKTSLDKV